MDRHIIEKVLEEIVDNDEEYERALELAERKVNGSYKNDESDARYRKLSSFLMRRGYSFDIIKKVMEKALK